MAQELETNPSAAIAAPQKSLQTDTGATTPTFYTRLLDEMSTRTFETLPAIVDPPLSSFLRRTQLLDGTWQFCTDPENIGEEEGWFLRDKQFPTTATIQVPGAWEAQGIGGPGMSGDGFAFPSISRPIRGTYEGTAWYKRRVPIPDTWGNREVWLKIGEVNAQGWFWVNGVYVGHLDHFCGAWKYRITDLLQPGDDAVIVAKVRNDVPSRKGLKNQVRLFGGLTRDIEIEITSRHLIEWIEVRGDFDRKRAAARVHIRDTRPDSSNTTFTLELKIADSLGNMAGVEQASFRFDGQTTISLDLTIHLDPLKPWSPDSPHLYRADVTLKHAQTAIDSMVERFGVRKIEVREGDLYLNDQRLLVRMGDSPCIYPIDLVSPVMRNAHRDHFQLFKSFGFNMIRFPLHVETPEALDMADEVGLLAYCELPYISDNPNATTVGLQLHASGAPVTPKQDLEELIRDCRRHPSVAIYSMGIGGRFDPPLDSQLYEMAKRLDPDRLIVHKSRGINVPENSDLNADCGMHEYGSSRAGSRAHLDLGCLRLGLLFDPRAEHKYTGAYLPFLPIETAKTKAAQLGLEWNMVANCLDAGYRLQIFHQKTVLEAQRLNPVLDGYSIGPIVDISSRTQGGLLDEFWGVRLTAPEYFRQFNNSIALLGRVIDPTSRADEDQSPIEPIPASEWVYASGGSCQLEWVVSHFGKAAIADGLIVWSLKREGKILRQDKITGFAAPAGANTSVALTDIQMPETDEPMKLVLEAELVGSDARNQYTFWVFPEIDGMSGAGTGVAATGAVFQALSGRYPGLVRDDTPTGRQAPVLISDSLYGETTQQAFQDGKSVLLLNLTGFDLRQPSASLGWREAGAQAGTVIARCCAFQNFPHSGYLDPSLFDAIRQATPLNSRMRSVKPIVFGCGSEGYLLYVFEAKVQSSRLLASGLDLLSQRPESVYLLDEFIRYVKSNRFRPVGTLEIPPLAK